MPVTQRNSVVIACLDGRRLKGYVYNLTLDKERFHFFPQDAPQQTGIDLPFDSLKAVFFVKDFTGDPKHVPGPDAKPHGHGRPVEVTFQDGEKISGTTEALNPQKVGFYIFPADSDGNNTRIFVVKKNAAEIKVLPAQQL